jgi:ribosomal protein S18 acetylase RimI-like enzyme
VIRELTVADEAALASFFERNNRPEVTETFHPFPLDAERAHWICVAPRQDRYFAAWLYDAIVGLAMLRGWDEGFETPSFGILVDYQHYGKGLGRALTEHALQLADELRAPRVRLTVHPANARAVHLYERAGFRRAENLPDGRLLMLAECR